MSRATGTSLFTISRIFPSFPITNAVLAAIPLSSKKTPYFFATSPFGWKSERRG